MADNNLPNNVPYRTINEFAENFGVKSEDLINIYLYGSHVYGTASAQSDYVEDNAIIPQHGTHLDNNNNETILAPDEDAEADDNTIKGRDGNDATLYRESLFVQKLKQHKQNVTECYFLPEQYIVLQRRAYNIPLDVKQLRHSFSKLVGNSYAKAGKKLTVEKDLDIRKGKKSLFHSLRILMFGIQIAQFGKIINYEEVRTELMKLIRKANELWKEIDSDPSVEWDHYHQKYKKEFNRLKSKFREVAPL